MKPEEVLGLLSIGEGQNVEFKTDCRNPKIVGPTICGFLNSSAGGYIVCGINEMGEITGIGRSDISAKDLERTLANDITPKTLISVQVQLLRQKDILVIEVPAGKDLPYAFQDVIYIRDGATTKKADVATIRDMVLRRQVEPERWERRFSDANTDKDIDEGELRAAITDINKTERLRFHDADNKITVLEDLSLFKYGHLTNGGDILFTKNPAVRYPQIRVRAARFSSGKTDNRYPDAKSFEGPLVPLLEEVIGFIQRNTPTASYFTKNSLKREDKNLYPSFAIREGLVNAFAHRDYSNFSGGITVNIYPDRLEIENTGRLPEGVTLDKLAAGHISVLRNPDIAHVLYLRGFMEKMGRGSVMIQKACTDHGLPLPQWSETELGVRLTFLAPPATREVPLKYPGSQQGSTPEVPGKYPGSTREVKRLLAVCEGEMSRQELQAALHLKDESYFRSAYLEPALQAGLIRMTIPEKHRSSKQKYRLTEKGMALIKLS